MNINYSTVKRMMTIVGILEMIVGVAILAKLYLMIGSLVPFGIAAIVVIGFFVGHSLMLGSMAYLKVVTNDELLKKALINYKNTGGQVEILNDDGTPLEGNNDK